MAAFLLVHSPLTGPGLWAPVAAELRERGHRTHVPDLRAALGDIPAMARLARPHSRAEPLVVVAHSGAGVALPAIAADLPRAPRACIFVDAQLPRPGRPADDELLAFLRPLVGAGGLLPPFPSWWDDSVLVELLPDAAQRARFASECPRLPLAAYEVPAPEVEGWPPAPCAYLRLSEAYDGVAAAAADLGWPMRRQALHHLAPLTNPLEVAGDLEALVP